MRVFLLTVTLFVVSLMTIQAQDLLLPAARQSGGIPVIDAIKQRQSTRDIAERPLDNQTLADLLWTAYGFNRADKRVIPTALNKQELDVYVILQDGVYLYDAAGNKLIRKASGDHRTKAGKQDYVYVAPVNLIYVADRSKETGDGAYISCGCAAQNVYLACASKGLGCRIRTSIDKEELRKLLQLADHQEALAGQTIGYKKTVAEASWETTLPGRYLGFEGDDRIGLVIENAKSGVFPITVYEDGLPENGHRIDDDDRYLGTATWVDGGLRIELNQKFDGRKQERVERALRQLTASVETAGGKTVLTIPANREWDRLEATKVP